MEYTVDGTRANLELSERNLRVLLAKLKDKDSAHSISKVAPDYIHHIVVKAVPDEAHYSDRAPGEMMHEPEFDVEEYRADLERRRDDLYVLAEQHGQQNLVEDVNRCENKARGIEIALSLLPKKAS